MGPFRIQNVYSGEADDASDSGSEFGIDSDVSDAELLELQRDLKKLDPKKMQRNLADATIACQASTMKRWERYCLPPPLSLSLSLSFSLSLSLSLFLSLLFLPAPTFRLFKSVAGHR
jgi:hypothetical protein